MRCKALDVYLVNIKFFEGILGGRSPCQSKWSLTTIAFGTMALLSLSSRERSRSEEWAS